MKSGLVSVNGEISSVEDAKISVLDRGLLYSDAVFETLVGFQDKILDVEAHLERLRLSAEQLHIDIPWTNDVLCRELQEMVVRTSFAKKNIRLVVSRGNGFGLGASGPLKANKIIYVTPAKPEPVELFEKGLRLKTNTLGYTERGPTAKTSNYLKSILAIETLKGQGYDDVLWANSSGEVAEASTANIFLLGRDGDLLEVATPHTQTGILAGITRAKLITLLNQAKIPVTERIVDINEIPRFDEAFLCSTVRGLVPIGMIDHHKLHTTRSNAIYKQFERLYFASVERDLGYKVDWNTGLVIAASTSQFSH